MWNMKSLFYESFLCWKYFKLIKSSIPKQNGGNITDDNFTCNFIHENWLVNFDNYFP